MPVFNDLKKLFFGAKSVAKHQGNKAADAVKETAKDALDKAPEIIAEGKEALDDLSDRIFRDADFSKDKAGDLIDENLAMGDLNPTPEAQAPKSGSIDFEDDLLVDAGTKTAAPGEPSAFREAADSALDAAARAGLSAKDKADDLANQASDLGNDLLAGATAVGGTLHERAGDLLDHANREAEKMRMDDAVTDAQAAAARAEARARAFDRKENQRDTSESNLSGTDSFFDRADRFAKGDYTNEGGKDLRVQDDPDYNPEPKPGGLITGFDDRDGDGDSLIDDAQIIEEE